MGKQVAVNTEYQETVRLIEDNGSYYIKRSNKPIKGFIKKEYHTDGNLLVYPKKWGNLKASRKLVDDILEEEETILEMRLKKIEGLKVLKSQLEKMR